MFVQEKFTLTFQKLGIKNNGVHANCVSDCIQSSCLFINHVARLAIRKSDVL